MYDKICVAQINPAILPMKKTLSQWFNKLGPGLITGAADDDPSGIATYSQGGAQYGFGTLWTLFFPTR
jgi:Mn2+/Fe2+ NRAMP family transporter